MKLVFYLTNLKCKHCYNSFLSLKYDRLIAEKFKSRKTIKKKIDMLHNPMTHL